MAQVVVFDLGKVLLDFDYHLAARKVASRTGLRLSPEELMRRLCDSPLLVQYETGLISNEQFYKGISAVMQFEGAYMEFAEAFSDIFTPIEPMIQLHASLRGRGVRTYVFSNTNDLAITHVRKQYPFFAHFDGYVFSYEHKVMKPQAGLYEVVERLSGCRGRELVYLDDRAENVQAGVARGWNGILHETPEKSIAALRQLGLIG